MLGMVGKLLSSKIINPRTIAIGGSAIGYMVGQEAVRSQGDALKAYYGEEEYQNKYTTGIGFMSAGVTMGAGYLAASAIFGRSVGKGFAPLGTAKVGGAVKRGAKSTAKMYKEARQYTRAKSNYKVAKGYLNLLQDRVEATPVSRLAMGSTLGTNPADQIGSARRTINSYRAHMGKYSKTRGGRLVNSLKSQRGGATQFKSPVERTRKTSGKRSLWPGDWKKGTLVAGGWTSLIAGAAAGNIAGRNKYHYPLMESDNISMANPVSNRLNYSTAGLTQALHDRRRTF